MLQSDQMRLNSKPRARLRRLLVLAALGSAFGVLTLATPASAGIVHPFIGSFDGHETTSGSFAPVVVAVDDSGSASAGDVYVSDEAHKVVDKFAAPPGLAFLCEITGAGNLSSSLSECDQSSPGTPDGSVGSEGEAVDPSTGDLWVAAGQVVDRFSPKGAFVEQVSGFSDAVAIAVNAVNGNVFIADFGIGNVDKYEPATSQLTTFASGVNASSVAIDNSSGSSAGDVYVGDNFNNTVSKFSPSGVLESQLGGPSGGTFGSVVGVAVDASNGDLYVADQAGGVVDQFDAAGTSLGQLTGRQTAVESMAPRSVAISTNGSVYVVDVDHAIVDRFGPSLVIPDATTGAASEVTATTAKLEGAVNPNGLQVTDCRIAYVDGADYNPGARNPYSQGSSVPCVPAAGSIPADFAEHNVSAAAIGLTPGKEYHFRLEVANANGPSTGQDATFSSLPRPEIASATVSALSANSATLVAKINPRGFKTSYEIEWGTSTAYGNIIPEPEEELGAGTNDVQSTQHLTGLHPNITYHWRVIATNINGTTTSPDQTFIYDTTGEGLPDGRAYEMVTPPHKNGALLGDVTVFAQPPTVSASGTTVMAFSIQCFANAESCTALRTGIGSPYAFTRSGGEWHTTALAPSAQVFGATTALDYSAETNTALFTAPTAPGGQDDFYGRQSDGSLLHIGPLTPPAAGAPGSSPVQRFNTTGDLSHLVWQAQGGAGIWPFDHTTGGGSSLYEYVGVGNTHPSLVGVTGAAASTDILSTCGTVSARGPGQFSSDGQTMYFVAEACAGGSGANAGDRLPVPELFARLDNDRPTAHTVAISQPDALSDGPPNDECKSAACKENTEKPASPGFNPHWRDARFYSASRDGSKAYFASTQQLTDSAAQDTDVSDSAKEGCSVTTGPNGCNLYLYDFAAGSGHQLVDVSAGDTSGEGPRVQGVMAASADGSHVYFVAKGTLTSGLNARGQSAQNGANNLYVFERDAAHPAGHLAFIAVLPSADASEWGLGVGQPANVTPDGRYLVFPSRGRLTADDTSASDAQQVFRYDAQTAELIRVSLGNDGFNNNGNRSSATPCGNADCSEDARIRAARDFEPLGSIRLDPSMSDDGAYVFFESPIGLTPRALDDVQIGSEENGIPVYAQNVYEYHAGHTYLISDGRDVSTDHGQSLACGATPGSVSSTCLLGVDATGSNVFFSSDDSLVPQDGDTELDYYDARICTAADPCVAPPASPVVCQLGACQGSPAGSPPVPVVASVTFAGPGNASAPGSVGGGRSAKVTVTAHTVHGMGFMLNVKVPGAGRIQIAGSAIKKLRRSVTHAGTFRFAVQLTAKAKRSLHSSRGHKLRVHVGITYSPMSGPASTAATSLTVKA